MPIFLVRFGSGVSVVMEPDFALRVFQQQTDNFYGYNYKAGQIERSFTALRELLSRPKLVAFKLISHELRNDRIGLSALSEAI